jgi:hypothetical protein
MKVHVSVDYSKSSDENLVIDAQHIEDKMDGNINFPAPVAPLTKMVAAKEDFITKLAACKGGGTNETLAKKQAREILLDTLRDLGLYVQVNCKNDLSIAQSSGFKTRREKEIYGVLPKTRIKVEAGPFPGSIKVAAEAVKGAFTYIYEWALTPVNGQTHWEYDLSSTSMIIKNLEQGKEYAFRVAAKGSAEGKVFSDVITHYVA